MTWTSEGKPAEVLLLALYAAVYPTLLAAVAVLLSQPRRLRLLSAYLAGGLTISIGLGLLIVLALKGSAGLRGSGSGLSWGIDLAVGGLALLAAVALATRADERLRRRRRDKLAAGDAREPWSQRILSRGSVPIVFFAGMAINLPGAAYLIALKDIAGAHHSIVGDVVLIVGFNLVMFLLAEIPWVGLVRAPERTEALVRRLDGWFSTHGRRLAIVMCAAFGVFLIVRGIAHS
jgi:Sap, sulfolipid-1-addressing protein